MAGVDAAGDEVVAGALGCAAGHEGGFDFEEAVVGQVGANGLRNSMAQGEVVLHLRAAEVEVAVLEADLFVGDGVVCDGEGRGLGVVEEEELVGDDFDEAGGHVGVGEAFSAETDFSFDGYDEFAAGGFGFGVGGGGGFLVEDDLGDAGAVAEVEEYEVAVVAATVDPAHEDDGLIILIDAEFAALMRALKGA